MAKNDVCCDGYFYNGVHEPHCTAAWRLSPMKILEDLSLAFTKLLNRVRELETEIDTLKRGR